MSGIALEEAYPILSNSNGCNDSAGADTALATAKTFGVMLHDRGQGTVSNGSGVGQFYNIDYGAAQVNNIHASSLSSGFIEPLTTGTLTATLGSPIITGSGTNFTAIFAKIYQHQTPITAVDASYMGIPGQGQGSCNLVLPVLSVQSDTQLTLASSWSCASATGITSFAGWLGAPAASNNCAVYGSKANTCEGVPDPSLAHEMHAVWSWLYWQTGNNDYLTWTQQSAGSDYGGPGGGPGTPTASIGPFATGAAGNFVWALPACNTASPPCGGYGVLNSLGKNYAFSAGAGNANNALAYMVLGSRTASRPQNRIDGSTRAKGSID
jgi:hypothetical protein